MRVEGIGSCSADLQMRDISLALSACIDCFYFQIVIKSSIIHIYIGRDPMKFATKAIHSSYDCDEHNRALMPPIYQTVCSRCTRLAKMCLTATRA